jgi:hypothetical protein
MGNFIEKDSCQALAPVTPVVELEVLNNPLFLKTLIKKSEKNR